MPIFDKMLSVILRPYFLVLFVIAVVLSYYYLDRDIALFFLGLHLSDNFVILSWITNLGSVKLYIIILPIFALVSSYLLRKKNLAIKAWFLWFVIFYPSLVATILKNIMGRARPILLFTQHDFGFFGWHTERDFHSFPSGHTTTVTSLFIGLTILFPRYFIYWLSFCLLVIISRVLLTYHYLSDVLASFYLVFLELGILIHIMRRKFPKTVELILK